MTTKLSQHAEFKLLELLFFFFFPAAELQNVGGEMNSLNQS